jgi:hypothetical protein
VKTFRRLYDIWQRWFGCPFLFHLTEETQIVAYEMMIDIGIKVGVKDFENIRHM